MYIMGIVHVQYTRETEAETLRKILIIITLADLFLCQHPIFKIKQFVTRKAY